MNQASNARGRCGQKRRKVKQTCSRFTIEQNGKKNEGEEEEEEMQLPRAYQVYFCLCLCVCAGAFERRERKEKVSLTKEQYNREQEKKEGNINYKQNGRRRTSTDRAPETTKERRKKIDVYICV
jgi:hypothetical protein